MMELSLEAAVAVCCDRVRPLNSEEVHIDTAFMRIAAQDIYSPVDVPGCDISTMDGYVISAYDLQRLNEGQRVSLSVNGVIGAGSTAERSVGPGESHKIMTGARLPAGGAAIVKLEEVTADRAGHTVTLEPGLKTGPHIAPAGCEIKSGSLLAAQGQRLNAEGAERIAAAGIAEIKVHKLPRVAIIDTGNELVLPGNPLKAGQTYASSRSLLAAAVLSDGALPIPADAVTADEAASIAGAINEALAVCDLILISGGTGAGDYDLVYDAMRLLSADLLYRGLKLLPGSGSATAVLHNKLLFNLPGKPQAAGIIYEATVRPALRKMKGENRYQPQWFSLPLGGDIKNIKPQRCLYRGEMTIRQGRVFAHPMGKTDWASEALPLLIDLQPGQGQAGDIVRACFRS
ncbi:MAG: molybdopterin molybdotransferase MoeA [Syntrophomonadaceae bacterium]|nr:molybdopterin molybdotransferase MoeA [Syntrophomonadaceae bacterium]